VKNLGAPGEHGRGGVAGVEPALVDLPDVGDQIGFDAARVAEEIAQLAQKRVVRDRLQGA